MCCVCHASGSRNRSTDRSMSRRTASRSPSASQDCSSSRPALASRWLYESPDCSLWCALIGTCHPKWGVCVHGTRGTDLHDGTQRSIHADNRGQSARHQVRQPPFGQHAIGQTAIVEQGHVPRRTRIRAPTRRSRGLRRGHGSLARATRQEGRAFEHGQPDSRRGVEQADRGQAQHDVAAHEAGVRACGGYQRREERRSLHISTPSCTQSGGCACRQGAGCMVCTDTLRLASLCGGCACIPCLSGDRTQDTRTGPYRSPPLRRAR